MGLQRESMKKTSVPLYLKLEKTLRKRIISSRYKPGGEFPTESEICREFDVSRMTVRQALTILEGDNLIIREQGRGTFVTGRNSSEYRLTLAGKIEDLFEFATNTALKLFSKRLISPKREIIRDLNLDDDEKVYLFEGVRTLDDAKAYFQAYVEEETGRKIRIEDFDSPLLIEQVEKMALERVRRAQQYVSADVADKKTSKLIGVKQGDPVLIIKRIYSSRTGRKLEVAITVLAGKTFHSVADLIRVDE